MLLSNLKSQIIRLVSGGIETDTTRYDFSDIEDKIHYGRAFVIGQSFQQSKRIGSSWTQQYISPFDPNLQDTNDFVRFKVPHVIRLDSLRDGFVYVGAITSTTAYRRVNNRAEMANYNLHRITKQNERTPKFIYSDGYIEVYGDTMIKELRVDGIFRNPTHIPSYNQDIDPYPISADLIGVLKDYLLKTTLIPEQQKAPDTIADGRETPQAKLLSQ